MEKGSSDYNKERVHYVSSDEEVVKAYQRQYVKDMDGFLTARAEVVVRGGLVVVLVPGRPNELPHPECIGNVLFEVLGSCLLDVAKEGKIEDGKVESLNIPIYYASPQEVNEIVDRNGYFTKERIKGLPHIA
nr:probable S-adenosylmethionine-dependent methyltransferase At5g38100 [Tanacetum cinerariifolium]